MSVKQVEEYYVFIQFKEKLSDDKKIEVRDFLDASLCSNYEMGDLFIKVDFYQDEMAADEFNIQFRKTFRNLIK